MAFPKASGYTNLNSGNFSPVIYSKKVQKAFRKSSVVEDITNTDYSGDINSFGDSVKIIKEPDITISTYAHSHVSFMDLATDRAGYKLRDEFDRDVLGYMSGYTWSGSAWAARTAAAGTKADAAADADELLAANKLKAGAFGGTSANSIPVAAGGGTGAITSPLAILNRIARQMDEANVDTDSRYLVIDPVFAEILMDEDSKLINGDFGGAGELRNGKMPGTLRGFRIYKSNNLPYKGTGAGTSAAAGSTANFGVIVAGHDSAVATAEQIAKTESFRSPETFADIVRGMQLYGRKVLRPEGLFTANYNLA